MEAAEQMILSAPGADLYILPEMWSTGFITDVMPTGNSAAKAVAWMKDMAIRTDAAICGSLAVNDAGQCFNRQYFVEPDGNIATYDKHHLFQYGGEDKYYKTGNHRTVVSFRGTRFLLVTCYDLRFPVWERYQGDYDAIICVANWPESRQEVWHILLRARAIENQCYVIGCNRVGDDPNCHYPLYKVITGDENTASDMAHFMNQFDKLAEALGCSVICCHHHSKGPQADKRVADRASGSGVFARDTDALLDMTELEVSAELRHQILNENLCSAYCEYLGEDNIPENERTNVDCLERRAETWTQKSALRIIRNKTQKTIDAMTAWRVEGTLREFPGFLPINMWFSYPVHSLEARGLLDKAQAVGSQSPYKKGGEAVKQAAEAKKLNDDLRFKACYEKLAAEKEEVTMPELFEAFNKSREEDYEKPLSRSTLTDKLNRSHYLEKVSRRKNGKDLPALIKKKDPVIHDDYPEDFFPDEN